MMPQQAVGLTAYGWSWSFGFSREERVKDRFGGIEKCPEANSVLKSKKTGVFCLSSQDNHGYAFVENWKTLENYIEKKDE